MNPPRPREPRRTLGSTAFALGLATVIGLTLATVPSARGQFPGEIPVEIPSEFPGEFPGHFLGRFSESSHRIFRGILASAGLNPVLDIDNLSEPELADVLMIVYGSPLPGSDVPPDAVQASARRVLSHGGSLLIVSEDPGPLDGYFPRPTGLAIATGKVFETQPELCLDNYPGSPYPVSRPAPDLELDALLELAPKTATNHPGALNLTNPSPYAKQIVVDFPATCRLGLPPQLLTQKQGLMVAGKGTDPRNQFRVLVVADTSVFMNQLLAISDPDGVAPQNLKFAYEAVRWLQGSRVRSSCYFVDAGRVQDRIFPLRTDYMEPLPPLPPLPNPLDPTLQARMTDTLNNASAKFEDANGFNRPIVGANNSRKRFYDILRVVAVMLLVVVLLTGLYRTWTLRHEADLLIPPQIGMDPPITIASGTTHLSNAQLVIVRELFFSQGIEIPDQRTKMPPIEVTGRNSARMTQSIRYLWYAMYGGSRRRPALPAKEVDAMIQSVWKAAQAGQWKFRSVGEAK